MKNIFKIMFVAVVIVTGMATAQTANAQTTSELKRVVLDNDDSPLAGAIVTITLPNGTTRSVVTDIDGVASFPNLPAGEYKIKIEAEGYAIVTYEKINLGKNTINTRTIQMMPNR